jgi:hypothetical protein
LPAFSRVRRIQLTVNLPDGIRTFLFDLDGVPKRTAKIHAQAWKQ